MKTFCSVNALASLEKKSAEDSKEGKAVKHFLDWVKEWEPAPIPLQGVLSETRIAKAKNKPAEAQQTRRDRLAKKRRFNRVLNSPEMWELCDGEQVELTLRLKPLPGKKVRAEVYTGATKKEMLAMLAEVNPRLIRDLWAQLQEAR
tara:strand:- start:6609 stop:7046 length:438 start_codon:yes stop_codon:yes gene_type:complete